MIAFLRSQFGDRQAIERLLAQLNAQTEIDWSDVREAEIVGLAWEAIRLDRESADFEVAVAPAHFEEGLIAVPTTFDVSDNMRWAEYGEVRYPQRLSLVRRPRTPASLQGAD